MLTLNLLESGTCALCVYITIFDGCYRDTVASVGVGELMRYTERFFLEML